MTNHKKPKRVKQQQYFTTKGKDPLKAVSSNLLIQQSETSNTIKNYNTAGINYDKRIYNNLVRNMEAQKIASQSDDSSLKIKLKNYGDVLRDDLKKSVGKKQVTIPQNVQEGVITRMQNARDQQFQADALTGDANIALATLVPVVEVNNAERKILSLVLHKTYRTKQPDDKTIARWAKEYARGDKAFVNTVLRKYYEEKGTSETQARLREEETKQAQIKTAMDLKKLKSQQSSSAIPITTRAKNIIIRDKLQKFPNNENITIAVKTRILDTKTFKDNNISLVDLNKFISARRNK
jgi:uncharacterized protein YdaU (DUF1376 family)